MRDGEGRRRLPPAPPAAPHLPSAAAPIAAELTLCLPPPPPSPPQTLSARTAYAARPVQAFKPASQQQGRQQLAVVAEGDSRIGKRPIPVPAKVSVTIDGQTIKVKVRVEGRLKKGKGSS